MSRSAADVVLTSGCLLALGLSAAVSFRPGGAVRERWSAWTAAHKTQEVLKREWTRLNNSPGRFGIGKQIRLVEFLDFQCPYCAAASVKVDSLVAGTPTLVVGVRHLPLSVHPAAEGAARAAICAERQGRFPTMARRLFGHHEWQQDKNWIREAVAAGVPDTSTFRRCLEAESTSQRLALDRALARELGVRGTPTFLSAHKLIAGVPTEAQLRDAVADSVAPVQ
jgi:protein-disulfide isomerase